jgi:MFS family permease
MLMALRNKALIPIFMLTFLMMFSMSIISAVNVLFALDLGATYVELGLISFLRGFLTMCLQIPFGILSDRLRRKPMILIPQLFILSSTIISSLATTPTHLILASFFGGFSGGAFVPVIVSLLGDLTEPSNRTDAVSVYYFISSLGIFIGPFAASLLLLLIPIRSLYYLSSIIRVGMLILIVVGIKEVKRERPEIGVLKTDYKRDVARLFGRRNMLVALVVRLFLSFFQSAFRTYVPVIARQELEISDALIASLGTFQGIARLGIRSVLGELVRRLTAKRLLTLTLCISGAAGPLLLFANSFYYLAFISCLFGLSHGVDSPVSTLLVADVSTEADRGFANSILYSVMSVGTFTPILTAPIAEVWGVTYIFPFVSIPPIIAAIVVARFMAPLSTEQK